MKNLLLGVLLIWGQPVFADIPCTNIQGSVVTGYSETIERIEKGIVSLMLGYKDDSGNLQADQVVYSCNAHYAAYARNFVGAKFNQPAYVVPSSCARAILDAACKEI